MIRTYYLHFSCRFGNGCRRRRRRRCLSLVQPLYCAFARTDLPMLPLEREREWGEGGRKREREKRRNENMAPWTVRTNKETRPRRGRDKRHVHNVREIYFKRRRTNSVFEGKLLFHTFMFIDFNKNFVYAMMNDYIGCLMISYLLIIKMIQITTQLIYVIEFWIVNHIIWVSEI